MAGLIPDNLHRPFLGDLAQNISVSCHLSTAALSLTSSTLLQFPETPPPGLLTEQLQPYRRNCPLWQVPG